MEETSDTSPVDLFSNLKTLLFAPNSSETLLSAISLNEYKVELGANELTPTQLGMLEKSPRIYCLTRNKLNGKFLLQRVKTDSTNKLVGGKSFRVDLLQKVSLMPHQEFGPMVFVSFVQGKRYVWECNDYDSLVKFLQSIAAVTFKSQAEMNEIYEINAIPQAQQPIVTGGEEPKASVVGSTEERGSELNVDELFKGEDGIKVDAVDIELLEAKWKKMLNEIDTKNAAYLVGLGEKTSTLIGTLDSCIKTMDAVDESFGVTFLHAKNLENDVNFLQTFNDALHIQTINQRSLFQVLFELIDSLTIGKGLSSLLMEANLRTTAGIKAMERGMDALIAKFKAHSHNTELDSLNAVGEQKQKFAQFIGTVSQRLFDFFSAFFKEQAETLFADKERFPKKERCVALIGHDKFFNSTYIYNNILSNLFLLDPEMHLQIVQCYCSLLFPVYQKEIKELIDGLIEDHLAKKQHASVTFEVKKSQSVSSNYPITKDSLGKNQKYAPHLILDYILKSFAPICIQEKIAIQRIFYNRIEESESLSKSSIQKLLEIFTSLLEPIIPLFYKADNSYIVKMIFSTERTFNFLSEGAIKRYANLERLVKILVDFQYLFVTEQLGLIEEQKKQLIKGKKSSVTLSYVAVFCEFVSEIQNIFRTSVNSTSPQAQYSSLSPIIGAATTEESSMSMAKKTATESILKIFTYILESFKLYGKENAEIIFKNLYYLYAQLKPKQDSKFILGINLSELLILPRIEEELGKYLRIIADNAISQSLPLLYEYFTLLSNSFKYFDPDELAFHPNFTIRKTNILLDWCKNESLVTQQIYNTKDIIGKSFPDSTMKAVVLGQFKEEFGKKIGNWNSLLEIVYPGGEMKIPSYTIQAIERL